MQKMSFGDSCFLFLFRPIKDFEYFLSLEAFKYSTKYKRIGKIKKIETNFKIYKHCCKINTLPYYPAPFPKTEEL